MINLWIIIILTLTILITMIINYQNLEKRVHQLELDALSHRQKNLLIKMENDYEYRGG